MNAIQSFNFGNIAVSFRADGYLNATAIAAHFGKQPRDYLKTEQTQQYIAALAENLSVKTKILTKENQIVSVKRGGDEQGTWLHPKLAIHFARWLDPKFAVWCDEQIEQIISSSLQPKLAQTTVADRTPLRQAVSALVGKCNIDYSSAYNMVHQRFGVESIEEIAADKLPDAIAYIHALTLHSGLVGELLDKQPAPALPVLDDETVLVFGRLLLHAQDMRLFVNRYLPAFQNLGIDGRGSLWSFVHDTEPTFAAARRFMTAQSVKSDFFARDWDWVQSRILSTARAF
nr:MAG TPA: KilA protein [Caudoviricetes sp.]